ncbi:MAG: 23S rRNA (adenine(2503)-C(2))-methyltransferase RlmN [Clostridia bacterium]|nr:23S rRNA (adenine(2503)-C(2))-methyltransferase RlmN [Clostridia bacterium]
MKIISDYNLSELKDIVSGMGEKPFRASQIFSNVHQYKRFEEMTELSVALREKLAAGYIDEPCKIIRELVSRDGTRKYLFSLFDGNVIEGVLMQYKYGNTLCVSTQVGCRMGCKFCASTLDGLIRNMSAGEMLSEILAVNRALGGSVKDRKITNVVLMGSGEPLDNYDNVIKFLRLLASPDGINISPRNVSLSTCGLVPKMYDLANEGLPVNLTVSLHSPFDEARMKIMPVAKTYKISEILAACDNYFKITGRRYYFEYSLIAGENDSDECADALYRLLKGKPCHLNLIRLNAVKERDLDATSDVKANAFLKKLTDKGISATLRRRMGTDIDGACGQLRRRYIDGKLSV